MSDTAIRPNTPLGVKIAIGITALHAWRISAILFLAQVGSDLPEFWRIAFRGDTFIGCTALIIAFLLAKYRSFNVWLLAFVWQFIGLMDLYVAFESQLISPIGSGPYFVIPAGMVLHATAAILLFQNRRAFF